MIENWTFKSLINDWEKYLGKSEASQAWWGPGRRLAQDVVQPDEQEVLGRSVQLEPVRKKKLKTNSQQQQTDPAPLTLQCIKWRSLKEWQMSSPQDSPSPTVSLDGS